MSAAFIPTDHEAFQIRPGRRSGAPVMIAIHSTARGPAVGGLHIERYASASDAIADCLRTSEAMTMKAAVVDSGSGGASAIVPLPIAFDMTRSMREAILLDVADRVHELEGACLVVSDVGTGPQDMDVIRRRTPYVEGRYASGIDAGGTTFGTLIGMDSAIRSTAHLVFNARSVAGLTVAIVGLDEVGSWLARSLANDGAKLILADPDEDKREFARKIGARWQPFDTALTVPCDVLVPCTRATPLTGELVDRLACRVLCGVSANRMTTQDVAFRLAARGVTYVPDFIADAGGLIYTAGMAIHHLSTTESEILTKEAMAGAMRLVMAMSAQTGGNTLDAAMRIARERLIDCRARA